MSKKGPSPECIFYKVLAIAPLSGDAKAVGGALLDHRNAKTGQLDPSQASLARRLGLARRTIVDALGELERYGLVARLRHGSKANRSAYQVNFALAATLVEDFEARRKGGGAPSEASLLHPKNRPKKRIRRTKLGGDGATTFAGQTSGDVATIDGGNDAPVSGGHGATQTLKTNTSNLTLGARAQRMKGGSLAFGQEDQAAPRPSPEQHGAAVGEDIPSRQTARRMRETERRRAAEGAWQRDLARVDGHLYERVMATMSETDAAYIKATEAELARPGGGLAWILAATGPPVPRAAKPT
ncbi:helix-turn-helix domain-containing protein [Sinorhizobium fredii]|uniref:helix-turn-helix domain-containing protein n=1 Tax=Rhizobium fredii TaxID=380 RepID=UPI0012FE001A|nr:helix-turn-helix domain-containing protein [Sinorhizobium fredii]